MTQINKEMQQEKDDVQNCEEDDHFLIGCAKGSII